MQQCTVQLTCPAWCMAVIPHLQKNTNFSYCPHPLFFISCSLSFFPLLHQIYARPSSKVQSLNKHHPGRRAKSRSTNTLPSTYQCLHYTEINQIISRLTHLRWQGSKLHNDIMLYLLPLFKLLPSCYSETHSVTKSRDGMMSGWKTRRQLMSRVLCIKTKHYSLGAKGRVEVWG